jgi:protein gp37
MRPEWARSLRDQCSDAGTAFFFKQWGAWWSSPIVRDEKFVGGEKFARLPGTESWNTAQHLPSRDDSIRARDLRKLATAGSPQFTSTYRDDDLVMTRIGKKAAGRVLDGQTWDEMPTAGNSR